MKRSGSAATILAVIPPARPPAARPSADFDIPLPMLDDIDWGSCPAEMKARLLLLAIYFGKDHANER